MSKKRNRTTALPKTGQLQPIGDTRLKQGRVAFNRADYAQAIYNWEGALASRSMPREQELKLKLALAEAYFRRGQHDLFHDGARAVSDLVRAADLKADDALYAYHVGLAEHRRGNLDQAMAWYRKAMQRDSSFRRANYPLALALAQSGQDVMGDPVWQALDEVQRLRLGRKPTGDKLSEGLGLAASGQWTEAKKTLAEATGKGQPGLAQGLADNYLGVIAQREGDGKAAVAHWQRAFDLGLNTPELVYNLSLAYTLQAESALTAGRPEEATGLARNGLAIAPDSRRLLDIAAYSRLQAGYSAAEKGDWDKALRQWSGIETLTGLNARALAANQAIAFEKLEDWESAAEAWRDFVRRRPRKEDSEDWLSPEQVARLWARVSSLYMRSDAPEEAISTLQTALKYQPDDPALMLSLARCYLDDQRIDAAYNQLDRVLKIAPENIDALVLRAELAETYRRRGYWSIDAAPGTHEWEAVLATNDEAYAPVAREHLRELYAETIDSFLGWSGPDRAREAARKAIATLPDDGYLRARYLHTLLVGKVDEPEVHRQMQHIDLTDVDALHQLIDVLHIAGRHDQAAETLNKANALKPLEPTFYVGVANCALNRNQAAIAESYFDQALSRATTPEARLNSRLEIGMVYVMRNQWDRAEAAWQAALKEKPAFGPAHLMMAMAAERRGDKRAARDHQQAAKRWGSTTKNREMLDQIRMMMQLLNSPLGRMSLPDMMNMLDSVPEEDEDFADFGSPFGAIDPFAGQQSYEPTTDRRRRRQQKRGGAY